MGERDDLEKLLDPNFMSAPSAPIVDLSHKMIKLDLYVMGFNRRMVDALLEHEVVEDSN
jgi:hypothetical protein